MKKLALIIGLLILFLIPNKKVTAACGQSLNSICPVYRPVNCVPGALAFCCETEDECTTSLQTQSQTAREAKIEDLCKFAGEKSGECMNCFGGGEAWTAIGCIPTSPSEFMERFLSLGIGLAGGIAFLLIIFSGFQMLTSVGNPEKLNAGKELLTSAISGLILIIFSIFLLRLIGVDILGLPEFK